MDRPRTVPVTVEVGKMLSVEPTQDAVKKRKRYQKSSPTQKWNQTSYISITISDACRSNLNTAIQLLSIDKLSIKVFGGETNKFPLVEK